MNLFPFKYIALLSFIVVFVSCKPKTETSLQQIVKSELVAINYAKGFSIEKSASGITIIKILSPWPDAKEGFTYALVPKGLKTKPELSNKDFDAIINVPIERLIVTSTTHIPALENLGVLDMLVGFPDTKYISSDAARKKIDEGKIKDLGNNESLNTEMAINLNPDLVIGFSINNQNRAYETLQRSDIPVVYNGDWTEETPLGKAEWIKFFAPFFGLEAEAQDIFKTTEKNYLTARDLALKATTRPTVLSGALYKDVWYLPGGKSWAASFINDANADYLWSDTSATGSLSLSIESVLAKAAYASFWISPSQFISYNELDKASRHYSQFKAYKEKKIYTFANTKGESGGLLFYELGPSKPDLILKDLIHIFHPQLLPEHKLFFFKPLQ
ncbi:ABC transporter substrate-binding protein [uncultured Eudoraea sp.]|uniref:ABC transporter substrate-binding protein n=1 Tax=uncultured Eudoraea sp. TaxID=1035614 RepID=UPI002627E82B|nr:ABC transporter substrate-binding protein [uncultured Eudoraea sp.]